MPDRIYILNLPYKPDRRERLAAHLAELDLFPADRIRWVKALSGDWSPGPAWWRSGNGAWCQLTADAQAHTGSAAGTTPTAGYEYADGTHNHTRHTATVYPAGRRLLTEYASDGSYDHRLSRPTRLVIAGEGFPAVDYLYAGLSWIVRTLYPQNNVELRHFKLNNESNGDAGDPYRAFDRFGRLEEVRWRHAETQGAWIEHLFYGYDKASLRIWKDVDAAGVAEDELFAYDGLYQVTQRQRGVLNTARTAITGTPERQEDFDFDPLGNWQAYTLRANGTVQNDQSNTRTHNQANQITAIAQTGATPATVAHDFAGNMTKAASDKDGDWTKGYHLKWDAWNRLVEVRRQGDDTHVATYHYDGLFRRTHSTVDGTDRHFIYDRAWRILEERPGSETATPDRLYTWGLRHRTDMVCRDAELPATGTGSDSGDTGGSTSTSIQRHYVAYDWISPTAILDPASGDPLERYSYSAFGQRKMMDAAYGERDISNYSWDFGFHGQFTDAETGWANYGFRYYSPKIAQWQARDPLAENSGPNLYSIVSNNTPTRFDLFGLSELDDTDYHEYMRGLIDGGTLDPDIIFQKMVQRYLEADPEDDWCWDCQDDMEELLDAFEEIMGSNFRFEKHGAPNESEDAKRFRKVRNWVESKDYDANGKFIKATTPTNTTGKFGYHFDCVQHLSKNADLATHAGGTFLSCNYGVWGEWVDQIKFWTGLNDEGYSDRDLKWGLYGAQLADKFDASEEECRKYAKLFANGTYKLSKPQAWYP